MNSMVALLGARPVASLATWLTSRRLRVLAYHGISDPEAFGRQLDYLSSNFATVSGAQVADAVAGGDPLPNRSIWITFDDGIPDVFRVALPLLTERGLTATAFVCPGLLDTTTPFWWQTVERAAALGLGGGPGLSPDDPIANLRRLKQVDDGKRRAAVHDLVARLSDSGHPFASEQATTTDLKQWLRAGQEIGNHTWDHPCLDRCDPGEQERQVVRAHEALTALVGSPPDLFAWPNGNASPDSAPVLERLGYRVVATFDHRLCPSVPDPNALSRLRVDAASDLPRFRSIASGAHSTAFHAGASFSRNSP